LQKEGCKEICYFDRSHDTFGRGDHSHAKKAALLLQKKKKVSFEINKNLTPKKPD